MKLKKSTKILVNIFCSFGVIHQAFAETYIVKHGDELSKILYDKNLKPIYGKNGTLLKVVAINKELKSSKGNIIYPGMILSLDVNITESKNYNLAASGQQTIVNNEVHLDNTDKVEVIAADVQSQFLPNYQNNIPKKGQSEDQEQNRTIANNNVLSRSDLSLIGISEFVRVKSTDSTTGASATFLSDASTGFNLAWGQNWSENFRSSLNYQSKLIFKILRRQLKL